MNILHRLFLLLPLLLLLNAEIGFGIVFVTTVATVATVATIGAIAAIGDDDDSDDDFLEL
jgi:hypothetical protein